MRWLRLGFSFLIILLIFVFLMFSGTVFVRVNSNCEAGRANVMISGVRFRPLITVGNNQFFVVVGPPEGDVSLSFERNQTEPFQSPNSYVTSGMISLFTFRADEQCRVSEGLSNSRE